MDKPRELTLLKLTRLQKRLDALKAKGYYHQHDRARIFANVNACFSTILMIQYIITTKEFLILPAHLCFIIDALLQIKNLYRHSAIPNEFRNFKVAEYEENSEAYYQYLDELEEFIESAEKLSAEDLKPNTYVFYAQSATCSLANAYLSYIMGPSVSTVAVNLASSALNIIQTEVFKP